jgi:uncharacterized protein (DUF2147 family)
MKKILVFLFVLFTAVAFAVPQQKTENLDTPIGVWKTIDDETKEAKSHVEIFESKGVLYGKIIKLLLKPPDTVCDKCQGSRKNKPVLGMIILWGLKQDGKEYTGGDILDPDKGKTYSCKIEVLDGGQKLKVRGFIGFSLLGRTQFWYRVK